MALDAATNFDVAMGVVRTASAQAGPADTVRYSGYAISLVTGAQSPFTNMLPYRWGGPSDVMIQAAAPAGSLAIVSVYNGTRRLYVFEERFEPADCDDNPGARQAAALAAAFAAQPGGAT